MSSLDEFDDHLCEYKKIPTYLYANEICDCPLPNLKNLIQMSAAWTTSSSSYIDLMFENSLPGHNYVIVN